MNSLSRRAILAVAAPLALASIVSGGVAFAASQSGSSTADTPAVIQQQAPSPTPANPTTPATPGDGTTPATPGKGTHNPANCPNMGGSNGGSSSSSTTGGSQTSFGRHGRGGPATMPGAV